MAHGEQHDRLVAVALGVERGLAREHLVERDPERVQVGASVDGAALDLLGGPVLGRAGDLVALGQRYEAAQGAWQLGQPEVEHLDEVAGARCTHQKQVGRLDVAVVDAVLVGLLQAGRHLLDDLQAAPPRQAALFADDLFERASVEQLHGQVVEVLLRSAVVQQGDGVHAAQAPHGAGLALEVLDGLPIRQLLDDLERQLPEGALGLGRWGSDASAARAARGAGGVGPVQALAQLLGVVDHGHAAFADPPQQAVAAGEHGPGRQRAWISGQLELAAAWCDVGQVPPL